MTNPEQISRAEDHLREFLESDGSLLCAFCKANYGESVKAVALAPQFQYEHGVWCYHPVCDMHLDGWWEGSDFPEDRQPKTIPLEGEVISQ